MNDSKLILLRQTSADPVKFYSPFDVPHRRPEEGTNSLTISLASRVVSCRNLAGLAGSWPGPPACSLSTLITFRRVSRPMVVIQVEFVRGLYALTNRATVIAI
jgi:hypothetical protein